MFVALVQQNSPAALAGLRFGDQILQINGQDCAGWDTDKAHKVLKQAGANNIRFALRDRYVVTRFYFMIKINQVKELQVYAIRDSCILVIHFYFSFIFKNLSFIRN